MFEGILDQQAAVTVLANAVTSDRIASAYLFDGPSGVGKRLAALAMAAARLCPDAGCGHCNVCTRIVEGKHPDVRILVPRDEGNRNLQVETVRNEILPFTKFAPFEGDAAFLIFVEADVCFPVIHPESANAMLKTLEEPRKNVSLLLLAERPDRLLPTIRSRCQRVRFGPLASDSIERILEKAGVGPVARRAAASLCEGRADRALALSDGDHATRLIERALAVDAAAQQRDQGALLGFSEELARSDDRGVVLDTLAAYYRDVAAAELGLEDGQLRFGHISGRIHERAASLTAPEAARRVQTIEQTGENLQRNANPQVALDALFFSL